MYDAFLIAHSVVRWVVIFAGALAALRGWAGWSGGSVWRARDERAGRLFAIAIDVQVLIGLVLYGVFSPLTRLAFSDMGTAMHDRTLRFFAVEHVAIMIAALALAHIGTARIRKATTDRARFRTAAVFFGLSLLLILFGIPWPFTRVARPWITV
jgi:hypothetical protein